LGTVWENASVADLSKLPLFSGAMKIMRTLGLVLKNLTFPQTKTLFK
jgi:hypothetical protein